jgi:Fe-S-cluster containining protein
MGGVSDLNLAGHLQRYLDAVERADRLFRTVAATYGRLMPCGPGCDECCAVYFEMSFIEAFYINRMFRETVPDVDRVKACEAARKVVPRFEEGRRLVRAAMETGEADPVDVASRLKIPCPLLDEGRCMLYEARPVTCRMYGVPELLEGGRVAACPKTAFRPGESYPTARVGEIQRTLISHSKEFLADLVGRDEMGAFPLLFTMPEALLTVFDRTYFRSPGKASAS